MTFARGKHLGMELEYDVLLFRHNNIASTVPYTINGRKKDMEVVGSSTQESGGKSLNAPLWTPMHLFVDPTKNFSYFVFFELCSWVDKNSSQFHAELLVTSLCRPLFKGVRTSLNLKLLSCISSP